MPAVDQLRIGGNTKVPGTPPGGLFNPTTTFRIVRGTGNPGF